MAICHKFEQKPSIRIRNELYIFKSKRFEPESYTGDGNDALSILLLVIALLLLVVNYTTLTKSKSIDNQTNNHAQNPSYTSYCRIIKGRYKVSLF